MRLPRHRSTSVGKSTGLFIVVASGASIWHWVSQPYGPEAVLIKTVTPYAIALILGFLLLLGFSWSRLPIAIVSIAGLLMNIYEDLDKYNLKDSTEIVVFLLIFLLVFMDWYLCRKRLTG